MVVKKVAVPSSKYLTEADRQSIIQALQVLTGLKRKLEELLKPT
jgi:hypothetical protein